MALALAAATASSGGEEEKKGVPSDPSPPSPISPQQRERMEANRRLALARQQQHRRGPVQVGNSIGGTSTTATTLTLTPQQEAVLVAVEQGRSVFVTGSAGTGKSFLLHHIIALLRRIHTPNTVFVTASTGIAACPLGGQTLHSFAGVGLGQEDKESLLSRAASKRATVKRWRQAAALVIDEISMVDGQLFDAIEYIARTLRSSSSGSSSSGAVAADQQRQWWGGIQLVVSGDFFQLPPINAPNPAKEFAFEASCWDSSFDLQVELTRIFRQSDSRLVDLLQGIRRGEQPAHHSHYLPLLSSGSPSSGDHDDDHVTRLFPRNNDVQRVNTERLKRLGKEVVTFASVDSGQEPWRGQLRQGIAPQVLELCVGARVMLIKNTDPSLGLVNGATGVVVKFVEEEAAMVEGTDDKKWGVLLPKVHFDHNGMEVTVQPDRWDVMEGDRVLATRKQIPLILAWALSVHKCQGMTIDRLHTDLSRAFGCGMVYVALSRVRSLEGLRLSGFDARKIKAHPKVLQFYNQLEGRQQWG